MNCTIVNAFVDCSIKTSSSFKEKSAAFSLVNVINTSLQKFDQFLQNVFLISNFRRVLNVVFVILGVPRRLNFKWRRFGTLCLFLLYRWCKHHTITPPMEMKLAEWSEMSAHKIQTMKNHPKERIQHFENLLCSSIQFISPYVVTFKNSLCAEGQSDFVSLCSCGLGKQTCKCMCWCAAQHDEETTSLICVKRNCVESCGIRE
jgi:hypothetical protein